MTSDVVRSLSLIKHKMRPNVRDYIPLIFEDYIELHGDRYFGDDAAVFGGIAMLDGRPLTVIGHVKGKNTGENINANFGMPHPEGYRKALRLMKQAEKFGRPIVCFVDTPGAHCGVGAEERGQGEAIARNLYEMMGLTVPVYSIVTGEGGSGGALALAVANEVDMLENAVYSVISPQGCASILWKDASKVNEAARALKMTSADLLGFGIIENIVAEPAGGAHTNPRNTADSIRAAIQVFLRRFSAMTAEQLVAQRYEKYRRIGVYVE